jgi:hypothetical protein
MNELTERLSLIEPAQQRRIVEPEFAPAGTDPADRRLQELTLNAARATLPSSLPAEVTARLRQLDDSLIHARGFRTVECDAATFLALTTLQLASQSCQPPVAGRSSTILAGSYELVLVADSGRWRGQRAVGELSLWKYTASIARSAGDSIRIDTTSTPFFGKVRIDFDKVGAPVRNNDEDSPPDSRDPLRPGVLVVRRIDPRDSTHRSTQLLISTVANRRDYPPGTIALDGTGIYLEVTRADTAAGSFAGYWDRYGLLAGGSGFFCARTKGGAAR